MIYTFQNRNGVERSFDNINDYLAALANQRRVEHLQELNAGHVSEEVLYDSQNWQEIPREDSTDRQK